MATFGEIQTNVSKRLLDASNTSVSSSDVAASINNSIRYWKYRNFWFNQISDTVTLTATDGTIPLTGSYLMPLHDDGGFVIEYSNMRYPLTKISDQQYNSIFLDNGYGLPSVYARIGQSYEVYPLPDLAYTCRREYLKEYTALVNSSDTNDFTNYADRLIMLWSCADLVFEIRRDSDAETYFRSAAKDEYNLLQLMTEKSNSTGEIQISSFLM